MPTQQVAPESQEQLQDVANALLKARKVVVITGAGISTNSGIPDFRSENGLYSLIQAQFDAAAARRDSQSNGPSNQSSNDGSEDEDDGARGPKRRKLSHDSSIHVTSDSETQGLQVEEEEPEGEIKVCMEVADSITVRPAPGLPAPSASLRRSTRSSRSTTPVLDTAKLRTPRRSLRSSLRVAIPTSPLSSPPPDIVPPSIFRASNARYYNPSAMSSSPLSSPPPGEFEDWRSEPPSDTSPSRQSSPSISELDGTPNSDPLWSQNSGSARNSLPNMKGKDLFDASIWADPLRTSVFYTFATSLRQKIRDCEPTTSHRFISHLRDRGKLVRCYTQNIDRIEEKVGLSTSLQEGPGSRGRFSRKSTNTSQLAKMVEEVAKEAAINNDDERNTSPEEQDTQETLSNEHETNTDDQKKNQRIPKLEQSRSSGVECVFLHGSLEHLRCFLCGRMSSWDDGLEHATLSGQQPECPHCIGATVAREERGKRALGVGKLRPDIVLYGEEHPNAHLISPIVTHDLGLCPDMLLILGTSLRVHGLKVLVREFAKAIHNRGGIVVFVNFTKPSESSWGDVIDYWVQWDCDAWVSDLQVRVPKLWETPQPPKRRKTEEEKEKERRERPPAANPVALRDTKAAGAYWVLKIRDELSRITGSPSLALGLSETSLEDSFVESGGPDIGLPETGVQSTRPGVEEKIIAHAQVTVTLDPDLPKSSVAMDVQSATTPLNAKASSTRPRRSRKSTASKAENSTVSAPTTRNPCLHTFSTAKSLLPIETLASTPQVNLQATLDARASASSLKELENSMVMAVKENPRKRKRKRMFGEENCAPTEPVAVPRGEDQNLQGECTLAPMVNRTPPTPFEFDLRPRPMEPPSPRPGPVERLLQVGQRAVNRVQDMFNMSGRRDGIGGHWTYQPQEQWMHTCRPYTRASGQLPFAETDAQVAQFMASMKSQKD